MQQNVPRSGNVYLLLVVYHGNNFISEIHKHKNVALIQYMVTAHGTADHHPYLVA